MTGSGLRSSIDVGSEEGCHDGCAGGIALDLQPGMLSRVAERAAREGVGRIRLLQAEAHGAGIPPGSLDGATLVMALGEIPDRAGVLANLHAALKPSGRLLVAESIFRPALHPRRTLRALTRDAGLSEQKIEGKVFGYACLLRKPSQATPTGQ